MLNIGEDLLLCDLAETYHIYSFDAVPLPTLATLAVGLDDNSRIKRKIEGRSWKTSELMDALKVDYLALLFWSRTKDAEKGRNRPKLMAQSLLHPEPEKLQRQTFKTPEAYEAKRAAILERIKCQN